MIVGVIGLGLIGGSFAYTLKKTGFARRVIGMDLNVGHTKEALSLGFIDQGETLERGIPQCDLIWIAIPVDACLSVLPEVLNMVNDHQTVMDGGSTKWNICRAVKDHPHRTRYVACHPIAGTENTGPSAAFHGLFTGKKTIICEKHKSDEDALSVAKDVFDQLKMEVLFMDPQEHDKHIAYVSHLSHITSFTLGKTVLDLENDEQNIFDMAGSGFASTVRLAKSSPAMWSPIFDQNASYISEALSAYIKNLLEFKKLIDEHRTDDTFALMDATNDIRRILEGIELHVKG